MHAHAIGNQCRDCGEEEDHAQEKEAGYDDTSAEWNVDVVG